MTANTQKQGTKMNEMASKSTNSERDRRTASVAPVTRGKGEGMERKYEHTVRVTFCNTNAEGNMSHDEYARLFGVVRELMGLDMIPGFKEAAGSRYLLKTKNAYYDYRRDFRFGDTIRVRMGVAEVTGASFTLQGDFTNVASGDIHAVGRQQIVFSDMKVVPNAFPKS